MPPEPSRPAAGVLQTKNVIAFKAFSCEPSSIISRIFGASGDNEKVLKTWT